MEKADRILRLNLTKQSVHVQNVPDGWREQYIGGIGFGVKILFDEVPQETDPYSPDNKMVLSVGPLTGTSAPMFPQTCIVTKSPLTGGALNTYAGGHLGPEIRHAGYNALIIEGKSPKPCYVEICDDEVNILDASHLWGKTTSETQAIVKHDLSEPSIKIACIGPAGENRVRFSSVIADKRAFGRGGSGAVMGSKNLKAIAVRGTKRVPVGDERFLKVADEAKDVLMQCLSSEWHLLKTFSTYGTAGGLPLVNEAGLLATRNHQEGFFEGSERIDADYFKAKKIFVRDVTCFNCPVHCGKVSVIEEGPYAGTVTHGPEYETIYAFGSNCGNDCAESIAKADLLCDEYGMDTLSTGVTIAFACECYERGIVNRHETGGLELKFGNHEAIIQMVEKIAYRRDMGDLLAEGTKRASEKLDEGSEAFAMQVKGLEFAAWMPRGIKGIALTFATSNRGACHKRAIIGDELLGKVDRTSYENKAELIKGIQDKVNAIFTLIGCRFSEFAYPLNLYVRLLNAATNAKFTEEGFLKVGERTWNMERTFSGFTRKDDTLPKRCFTEPIPSGPSKGHIVDRTRFEKMLDRYYEVRGWDANGVPLKK